MSDAIHLELRKCEDDAELRVGDIVAYITEEGAVQLRRVTYVCYKYSGCGSTVHLDDGPDRHHVSTLYRLYTAIDFVKP